MAWFLLSSARFPHPLPLIDWIAIVLQLLIDGAGIAGNIALLLAIWLKSPRSWSSYKILLANGAIIDLTAAISCLLSIERMIPSPFGTAMVYLGPCTLLSPFSCHLLHSVMMNAMTHSIYLVATNFFYRLYILRHPTPSRRSMIVLSLLLSILPLFMVVCTLLSIDDEAEVREAFSTIYDLDDYVVQGHIDAHPKLAYKFSQFYTAGSAIPVTLVVIFLRRKVISTLDAQREVMSERTANVHATLVLTLQAALPALFTLTITCYVIEKFGLYHSPPIEHTIRVTISLMTAIAPYISIFNIRVFRDFILCRKQSPLKSSLSIASGLATTKSTKAY